MSMAAEELDASTLNEERETMDMHEEEERQRTLEQARDRAAMAEWVRIRLQQICVTKGLHTRNSPDMFYRHAGKEYELYMKICKKYGVEPETYDGSEGQP